MQRVKIKTFLHAYKTYIDDEAVSPSLKIILDWVYEQALTLESRFVSSINDGFMSATLTSIYNVVPFKEQMLINKILTHRIPTIYVEPKVTSMSPTAAALPKASVQKTYAIPTGENSRCEGCIDPPAKRGRPKLVKQ